MKNLVEIYLGRQPILDEKQNTFGYEILYRKNKVDNEFSPSEDGCETSKVLINLFSNLGLNSVAGRNRKVFINYNERLLSMNLCPFFNPKNIVIEILETVRITEKVYRTIKKLKILGFTIALDDYSFNPEYDQILHLIDIIKFDIKLPKKEDLERQIKKLKTLNIILLAEKIETHQEFIQYKNYGFDLFQGYFFAKPDIIHKRTLPISKINAIQALLKIYAPDTNIKELCNFISHDISLSHKLLTTASGHTQRKFNNIHEAITYIGLDTIQSWLSVIIFSSLNVKPVEIYKTSLIRARFCERLGGKLGKLPPQTYFLVGLLSTLDAILNTSMEEAIAQANLSEDVRNALIKHDGLLGTPLHYIKSIEKGEPINCYINIDQYQLSNIYIDSLRFANNFNFNQILPR